jgi:maltose O-acetyltransferase
MTFQVNQSEAGADNLVVEGNSKQPRSANLINLVSQEFCGLYPWFLFIQFLVWLLPHHSVIRLRTVLYRLAGIKIGKGTVVIGKLSLTGNCKNLIIGDDCLINSPFYGDLNAPIKLGRNVAIGHHVVLITTNHDFSHPERRAGAVSYRPIIIEDGAWIGARVTILPGVTVGAGSVVGAGSLVTKSVTANVVVGGVPAKPIKNLDGSGIGAE